MSITVSAASAVVFDTKVWYLAWTTSTTNYTKNWQTFTAPSTISTSSTQSNNLCFAFKTNMIIPDDAIIVIVMNMQNYNLSSLTFRGVGQATSGTLPTAQTTTNALEGIQYTQEIIANTQIPIDTGTQFTITIRAKGFTNQYPIIGFKDLRQQASNTSISIKSIDLYQSVQEAASSGATPEEMRDVLSQWTDEELGPVIKDNVQEGVQAGMEEALENEKQQAHGGASGSIDDVTGALEGVTADMEEVAEKVEEFIRSFAYQGTSAVITFPALDVPVLGHISDAITFDMAQKATEMIPSALLMMLRVASSLGLVLYPVWQTIKLFKELFDVYEGV